ncbi:sirohydrochlorin cobaltochelatase [Desulfovibrio sp. OttesenSCG-928-C06]|nr:sirohydrochlorin cobaltochelatase [Desulfovibrio sp. OttesenSCG-928-C06]
MKKAVLLAAYGSTEEKNAMHLGSFETMVRAHLPGYSIRWAFTSMLMRNRLAAARKKTDSVKKALCRLGFEKFSQITVQSLHIIPGSEYEDMLAEIKQAQAEGAPADISVGIPLLGDQQDLAQAAEAVCGNRPELAGPDDAIIWVGHGTSHQGNSSYQALTDAVQKHDSRIFIGTLEDGIEPLWEQLCAKQIKKAWLMPLLAVVGRHAAQDIAGAVPQSWKSRLSEKGIECIPVTRGIVEYPDFTEIWLRHLLNARKI